MNRIWQRVGEQGGAAAMASIGLLLAFGTTSAAATDIATVPIPAAAAAALKPNIMLLMDTSESMTYSHMPDQVEFPKVGVIGRETVGYKASTCNSIYYDPKKTYNPPKTANPLVDFPAQNFKAAEYDGFGPAYAPPVSAPVDLSKDFQSWDSNTLQNKGLQDTKQAAYYYVYVGGQTDLKWNSDACLDKDTGVDRPATNGGMWIRKVVSGTSGVSPHVDEQVNFANWYSYYRTRILMTKSAASLAFSPMSDAFRVGFITVMPKAAAADTTVLPSKFLAIGDFDALQRTKWFDKLFTQTPFGSSPAREGLARVGRYYAGEIDSINDGMPAKNADDPLKYSCQQNFTIMTTDGYWNTQGESTTGFGGPLRIDGKTRIIQADGDYPADLSDTQRHCPLTEPNGYCPWPIHDGAIGAVVTREDAYYIYDKINCGVPGRFRTKTQTQKQISQFTKTFSQVPKRTVYFTTTKEQDTETKRTITRLTTKRKMTTEQFVLHTDDEIRTRWQAYESTFQYTKKTEQQLSTSKQMFQREYEIRKTEDRQRETSVQNVQLRRQWLETRQQWFEEQRQYTVEKRQVEKRVSRVVGRATSGESYSPTASCPAGWQCQTLYDSPFPTWTVVKPSDCSAGQDTANSPYWITECRAGPDTAAPATTASCSLGDVTQTAYPWIRTICMDAQLQAPTAVAWGTYADYTDASNVRHVFTTPANGNNTTVVDGGSCQGNLPAFDPLTKAPYLAADGSSGAFVRVSCTYNLDDTQYPASCGPGVEGGGIHRGCSNPATTNYDSYVKAGTCSGGTFPLGRTVSCGSIETLFPTAAVDPNTCLSSGWFMNGVDPWYRTCTNVSIMADTYVPYGSCAALTGTSAPYLVRDCVEPTATNYVDRPVDPNGPACAPSIPSGATSHLDVSCTYPAGANNDTIVVAPGGCTADPNPSSPFIRVTCGSTTPTAEVGPVNQATCPIGDNLRAGNVVQRCRRVEFGSPVVGTCMSGNSGGTVSPGNPATDWIQTDCGTGTNETAVPNCGVYTLNVPYDDGNGRITTCVKPAGSNNTANLPVLSCTPNPTPASPYVYVSCSYQETFPAAIVDPGTCMSGEAGAEREVTTCTPNDAVQFVDECSPVSAEIGNGWTETLCTNLAGPNNAPTEARGPACGATVVGTPYVTYDANHVKTVCRLYDSTVNVAGTPPCVAKTTATAPDWEVVSCGAPVVPYVAQLAGACTSGDGVDYPDVRTSCSAEQIIQSYQPSPPCTSGVVGLEKWTCTLPVAIETNVPDPGCTYSLLTVSPFTETTCTNASTTGEQLTRVTRRTTTVSKMSGTFVVGTPTVSPPTDSDYQTIGSCEAAVVVPAPVIASNTSPPVPSGCGGWPCSTSVPGTEGSLDSLADVAQYYYKTDLRPLMTDNVKPRGTGVEDDKVKHQHMTTFVVGLGVDGTLDYTSDYHVRPGAPLPPSSSTAFAGLRSGSVSWPVWPLNVSGYYANTDAYADARSIDDFWHTAVNGRGLYFSAKDPQGVVTGLGNALTSIAAQSGSGAADGASSFTPTAGNNSAFVTSYKTVEWTGDLQAFPIDLTTGGLGTTQLWSAKGQLDLRVGQACDDRKIYLIRIGGELTSGGQENLVNFAWNSKTCGNVPIGNDLDGTEQAFLDSAIPVTTFSQWGGTVEVSPMTDGSSGTEDQKTKFKGANFVNFLRGHRQHEGYAPNTTRYYRSRVSVLGDFVGSQPVFVGAPFAQYQDVDYATFASTRATRAKTVYVGGNDGMLHAFDAATGAERWAIVPRTVLPELYRLGDAAYAKNHRFFVDGSPVVGDVFDAAPVSQWKTILVGGLNAGGRGFYALDVTDPNAPKALWEFNATGGCAGVTGSKSDCNVGLSFGKPVITKLGSTWVVLFTSGYNNTVPGDGGGYLYVVNAVSGALINRIATGAGSTFTPSGLAQINNFVDDTFVDNTTIRAYGGDLLGNIWRFQFGGTPSAVKIGETKDAGTNPQPITTRPELAEVDNKPMIFVGTGQLLGPTDTSTTLVQSIYGIIDPLTAVGPVYADLRTALKPLQLTQIGTGPTAKRTIKCPAIMGTACARTAGWFVDLQDPSQMPNTGERVNIDMKLVFGTLVAATNVPSPDACSTGGFSWLSYLDYKTGLPIASSTLTNLGDPTSGNISSYMGDSLIAGFNIYQLIGGNNNPFFAPWARLTSGDAASGEKLTNPPPTAGKRISWREIAQ